MKNNPKKDAPRSGRVFQINISKGGVPKKSIDSCQVSYEGLIDDSQKNKKLHGGRERALCLYSIDLILELVNEGHRVFPGALGENITFSGLEWDRMEPQVRLKIGSEVAIQITSYTSPCHSISKYIKDGSLDRITQKLNPGWSRVYAMVLQPGTVRIGDPVEFET